MSDAATEPTGLAKQKADRDDWISAKLRETDGKITNRQLQDAFKAEHAGIGVSNTVIVRLRQSAGFQIEPRKGGWPKGKKRGPRAPAPATKANGVDLDVALYMEDHGIARLTYTLEQDGTLRAEVEKRVVQARTLPLSQRRR